MDHGHFDELTRSLATEDETRRGAFRLLAGGALGMLAARLGLGEGAKAKNKKPKRKRRPERTPQGTLQAEGKGKGKKGKKKPKPEPCGPGEHRCGPGPCVRIGQCCSDQKRCPDGSCVAAGRCCAGEKPCADGGCVSQALCCLGERMCADGACQPQTQCCPDEWQCADGSCVDNTQCCPGEKSCGGGVCLSEDQCCPGEKACGGGVCVDQDECCPGEKRCEDGSCIAENECCADAPYPLCNGGCQRAVCINGNLRCVDRELGALCKVPGGDDGTCCNGQCTREAIICPTYPSHEFNPGTCKCECMNGGIPDPSTGGCCPAGYPRHDGYGRCYVPGGDASNWACLMGYHRCSNPQYPQYPCCRDGT